MPDDRGDRGSPAPPQQLVQKNGQRITDIVARELFFPEFSYLFRIFIQKFFGGLAEFRKTIANKVSGDEETFREFCDGVES